MTTTPNPTEAQLLAGLNAFYRAEHEQANIKRPFIDAINLDDWSPQAIARMRAEAMMFEDGGYEWIAESDPDDCLPHIARALCEAYTEGKLT